MRMHLTTAALVAAAVLAGSWPAAAAVEKVMRVGFLPSSFASVNEEDARIAMELWAADIAAAAEAGKRVETVVYPDAKTMVDAVARGETEFGSLPVLDYLKWEGEVDAFVVGVNTDGQTVEQYLLMVRRDGDFTTWSSLRGARCLVHHREAQSLPEMWLDVELSTRGLGRARDVMDLHGVDSASKAILPVFFGQADACVATSRAMETMCELNPQLRQELLVLGRSASMLPWVAVIGAAEGTADRDLILKVSTSMHERPQGRQILELFGLSRVAPFDEADLAGVRALLREHARLESP